ncbi:lipoprotein signal peptidase [Campylobacterota bacterium]|nr:lipoprotein signal peptidase [Campylobacterota bacterium]
MKQLFANKSVIFCLFFLVAFALDRVVKLVILDGFRWDSEAISIILTFNDGVAFSWFAFLGEWLKWLQLALIVGAVIYLFWTKLIVPYGAPIGLLLGAGASNLLDRFVYGGVVDYVFWHYWFNFAVFNLADALIDCAVAWIVWAHWRQTRKIKAG